MMRQLSRIDPRVRFDITILRDIDIREFGKQVSWSNAPATIEGAPGGGFLGPRATDVLRDQVNADSIAALLTDVCKSVYPGELVSAFGTYFPNLSSVKKEERDKAVAALTNTIKIALELKQAGCARQAVVETVCGSILDVCTCDPCRQAVAEVMGRQTPTGAETAVRVFSRDFKITLFVRSLLAAIDAVLEDDRWRDAEFAVGCELEPGDTYVLNDDLALETLDTFLRGDPIAGECLTPYQKGLAAAHVGINLDIAHMRIAGVGAPALERYLSRIVHAHISDHPGLHTQDQSVGNWTPLSRNVDVGYEPYIKLLERRAMEYASQSTRQGGANSTTAVKSSLPFSNAVAIELEGSARLQTVGRSVAAMRQIL